MHVRVVIDYNVRTGSMLPMIRHDPNSLVRCIGPRKTMARQPFICIRMKKRMKSGQFTLIRSFNKI